MRRRDFLRGAAVTLLGAAMAPPWRQLVDTQFTDAITATAATLASGDSGRPLTLAMLDQAITDLKGRAARHVRPVRFAHPNEIAALRACGPDDVVEAVEEVDWHDIIETITIGWRTT